MHWLLFLFIFNATQGLALKCFRCTSVSRNGETNQCSTTSGLNECPRDYNACIRIHYLVYDNLARDYVYNWVQDCVKTTDIGCSQSKKIGYRREMCTCLEDGCNRNAVDHRLSIDRRWIYLFTILLALFTL